MEEESMLTTVDNPFDPFTQFDEWQAYDTRAGHNSLSFLARIVITSDSLSDAQQMYATNRAIEEIVELDVTGIYMKATRSNQSPARKRALGQ